MGRLVKNTKENIKGFDCKCIKNTELFLNARSNLTSYQESTGKFPTV